MQRSEFFTVNWKHM